MRTTLTRTALLLSGFLLVAFVVFLVNQTAQLVELAARMHPIAGDATLWGLVFLYAACLAVPAFMLLRLPKPLAPPEREDSPEFDEHVARLTKRLAGHPALEGRSIASRAELEEALTVLDERADEVTKATASQVFVTTAVSQNGALDAVLVLAAQSKMVLRIARTYYQRPTLRDLTYLYANVATTSFLASEIEDIDLAEQVQPVLSAVLGSAGGAVPGLQSATSLLVNSVMTGSANALLVLRTGAVAKRYCGALVQQPKGTIRRSATAEAAQALGAIALDGARQISGAIVKGSTRAVGSALTGVGSTITGVGGTLRSSGSAVWERVRPQRSGGDEPAESGKPEGGDEVDG